MYVINQTRSEVTNLSNVTHLNIDEECIYAHLISGTKRVLGTYPAERCVKVFYEMLVKCFPSCDPKLCFDNPPVREDCGVYYMPEE